MFIQSDEMFSLCKIIYIMTWRNTWLPDVGPHAPWNCRVGQADTGVRRVATMRSSVLKDSEAYFGIEDITIIPFPC